jgi:pimeloyl-ACP methyl ester carboxylesterase
VGRGSGPGPRNQPPSALPGCDRTGLHRRGSARWLPDRGQLCTPTNRLATTVQVLLHGLNYSHLYWDFQFQPDRYSYVRWANRAGFATFNLDRIGVGRSSHPPSGAVTLQSNALTIHQVVTALRGSLPAGPGYHQVMLVGHSFGSEIAKQEASRYGDVDALVLTGNGHRISPSGAALAAQFG